MTRLASQNKRLSDVINNRTGLNNISYYNMAEGEDDRYIERIFIGERLNEEYPRQAASNSHIQYFYFQVEVRTRAEQGDPLEGDILELTELNDLFPDDLFEWSRIVENFGTVKNKYLFKITYMAKYKSRDPPETARQVEMRLGDSRLAIREKFKKEVYDTSGRKDVDVLVLMSRCCNYYNGGIN